jgi:hypothetical protein
VVEGTGLENRRTRKGIVSSNLTLSVEQNDSTERLDALDAVARASASLFPGLSGRRSAVGRVAEWFKAHAWKVCVRASVPWVRIPPRPLDNEAPHANGARGLVRLPHTALRCLRRARAPHDPTRLRPGMHTVS